MAKAKKPKKGSDLTTLDRTPVTMSTVSNSKNFAFAEVVTAFGDKRKGKLLSICTREKEGNPQVALFAILCWLYLEAKRTVVPAQELGPREYGISEKIDSRKPADDTKKAIELLTVLRKEHEVIDTGFFERSQSIFFIEVVKGLKQTMIEYELQNFFPNSYYMYDLGEEVAARIRASVNLLYHAFLKDNPFLFENPEGELEAIGNEFFDRIMAFIFGKERNKNGGSNRTARTKAYQLFLVVFHANYELPENIRRRWSERLWIWLNVEQYIDAHPEKFAKATALLKKALPSVVAEIQQGAGEKDFIIGRVIEEKLRTISLSKLKK